ncbi:putative ribonuclease H-like domain-containing protein, partial [Tanacetum coccineum]
DAFHQRGVLHLVGPSHASEDTRVVDQEIELGNIPQSYAVPTTPHIRIHKDHPIDHVIGDVQSSIQTRRMTTSYSELGFLSVIYEGKTHQDLHTCLFACFLSQEEPKRVSKALSDPTWVEAMQEELLQFKLQKVWILMDLPKGYRAIGTKWVYINKKDERGIVIRNKARLAAQGHTQEEGTWTEQGNRTSKPNKSSELAYSSLNRTSSFLVTTERVGPN